LILLGDVAGKGVGAAMLTALVHATFHSLAGTTSDPAQLLESMNRLMLPDLERAGAFVTCALVSLQPASLEMEYASAGHVEPAIWKVSTESVEFLPATGLPLGIEATAEYGRHSARLLPGEVLLLYSDGVSEAQDPRGKVLGVQGLADILYAAHAAPPDRLIDAILSALNVFREERPLGDDVALLAIRALPAGPESPVIPFVLPADLSAVRHVVDMTWQAGRAAAHPSSEAHAHAFSLALTEVVANQVRHAYDGRGGRIQGCLVVGPDRWTADLYDSGRAFVPPAEPWSRPDPLDPPTRGYGLRLIYGLVDVVEYRRMGGVRNHWHLEKSLVGGGG
jgi:anti-sigma regulatory factor (Ser/Thr protein kinase)